jgi:hypothetical protein
MNTFLGIEKTHTHKNNQYTIWTLFNKYLWKNVIHKNNNETNTIEITIGATNQLLLEMFKWRSLEFANEPTKMDLLKVK